MDYGDLLTGMLKTGARKLIEQAVEMVFGEPEQGTAVRLCW